MLVTRIPGSIKKFGTAAAKNIGMLAGQVLMLDSSARIPAVDGSLLTNLPAGSVNTAYDNAVINGGIDVSQELGTTGATPVNNTTKYIADCIEAMYNHGAATAVITSAQLAAASFPAVLAGFSFGHQIKATTAITAPANGDFAKHRTRIEGYRIARWGWGAAGALGIVVAFRLYSTASGVALVRLSNSAGDRFYYHEITVAAGWNFYAFAVAGDTSGTWLATNGTGLNIEVFVSGKETTPGTSFDTWGATAKIQTTNSTNLLGTNNNLTIWTGVFCQAGSSLPSAGDLPKLIRPFNQEVMLCKRYWEKSYNYAVAPATITDEGEIRAATFPGAQTPTVPFEVEKRALPTMVFYSPASGTVGKAYDFDLTADVNCATSSFGMKSFTTFVTFTAANQVAKLHYTANARL